MTVSAGYAPSTYTADGNTRNWAIAFEYDIADEVHVRLISATGEITEISTNYSVDTDNDRVIYPTVASGLPLVVSGISVVVYRSHDNEQTFDAEIQPFSPAGLNGALDAIVKRSQETNSNMGAITNIHNDVTIIETDITGLQSDISTINSEISGMESDITILQDYDQSNTSTIRYILQNLGGGGGGGGGGGTGSAYDILNDCGCVPGSDSTISLTSWFAVNTQPLAIYIPPMTFTFDTNFTFPENCKAIIFDPAGSAILSPSNGAILTFSNQWIEAVVPNNIFGVAGDLDGTFRNDRILPEWWGAETSEYDYYKTDYVDTTIPMQKCFQFAGKTMGYYPVVWLNPRGTKRTYYVTDSLIKETHVNYGLRIDSASIANAKNSEGRNQAVIELGTEDNSKFLFHMNRDNWGFETPVMIRNCSFRAFTGGGVMSLSIGTVGRILVENVNTYGIHSDNLTDWINNELVQIMPDQVMWYLRECNGLIFKTYTNEGGWICFDIEDSDDMSFTDLRISCPIIFRRMSQLGPWQNGQQINIKNIETEQSLAYIINGYGSINVDGWHEERNPAMGQTHQRDLTGEDSITCETTADSNVLVFSEDMTNKLHPNFSVIRILNPNNSLFEQYYIVKGVNGVNVTVYANEDANDDTYTQDVNWSHAANQVRRYHSYLYLGIPLTTASPPSVRMLNVTCGFNQYESNAYEHMIFIQSNWYSLQNVFISCHFEEAQFGDNGVKILGNRIGNNNDSGFSNTANGCVFIDCNTLFMPRETNHPGVVCYGPDLSLGNTSSPQGRVKNLSTPFERKVLDRRYFFGLRDLFNRLGWASTHRYNIFSVGEPGTDQYYMAAYGKQIYIEDYKFPNHECILRFRLLAFTAAGEGDLKLTVSASGAGEFMTITITEERAPIEFITIMPSSLVGRTVDSECMFFITHDTQPFYFVACEITEELNPYIAGAGLPQGSVFAPPGTMYLNRLGGQGTSAFVKESGYGKTGWAVIGKPAWYDLEKDAGCVSGQSIVAALNSFFDVHRDEDLCLYIGKGTWVIDDDYQFNVYARTVWFDFAGGAVIQVNENCLFRWNRQNLIASPQNQLFSGDGYVGGQLYNDTIYPEWFGVKSQYYQSNNGDYTDYTALMKKCLFFANDGNWQPTIWFNGNGDKGVYYYASPLLQPGFLLEFDGSSRTVGTLVKVGNFAKTIVDAYPEKSLMRYTGFDNTNYWNWEIVTNSSDNLAVDTPYTYSTIRVRLANTTPSKNSAANIQAAIRAVGIIEANGTGHVYQDFSKWTIQGNPIWDFLPPVSAAGASGYTLAGKGVYAIDSSGISIDVASYQAYDPFSDVIYKPNFNFKIEGRTLPGGVDSNSEGVIIESGITDDTKYLFDVYRESYSYVSPIKLKNICIWCPHGGGALRVREFHNRCLIENFDVLGKTMSSFTDFMGGDTACAPGTQNLVFLDRSFGLTIKNYTSKGGFIGMTIHDAYDSDIENLLFRDTPIAIVVDTDGDGNNDTSRNDQINIRTLVTRNCPIGISHRYGRLNIDGWNYFRDTPATVPTYEFGLNAMAAIEVSENSNFCTAYLYPDDCIVPNISIIKKFYVDGSAEYYIAKSDGTGGFSLYVNNSGTEDIYSQTIHQSDTASSTFRINSYAYCAVPRIIGVPPQFNLKNFYSTFNVRDEHERIMFLYPSAYGQSTFTNCIKYEQYNSRSGVYILGNRILDDNSSMLSNTKMGIQFFECNAEFLPTAINHPGITVYGPDLSLGNTLFPQGRSKNFSTVFERKILDKSYFFGLKDIFNRLGWIGSNRYPISVHGESGTDQAFFAAHGKEMHMEDYKFPNHACYLRIKILAFTTPSSGTLTLLVDAYGTSASYAFTEIVIAEDYASREIIVSNPAVMINRTMNNGSMFVIRNSSTAFHFCACEIKEENNLFLSGYGSPEAVQIAPIGCLYTRRDGGAGTTLYLKESGSGSTGWIAK